MPCCVAAKKKRLSYRLIRHPIRRPRSCVPKILTEATVLDLGIPAEKSVHDFLLRAASGHSPLFRVEAMNRNGNTLLVVIESCQGSPFVLALSLTKKTLSLRSWYPSKDEAKLAIVEHPTRTAEHVAFGRLLRDRRVMARMSRRELAQRAGISVRTLKNVERALCVPTNKTLFGLLFVAQLDLTQDDLPQPRNFGVPLLKDFADLAENTPSSSDRDRDGDGDGK